MLSLHGVAANSSGFKSQLPIKNYMSKFIAERTGSLKYFYEKRRLATSCTEKHFRKLYCKETQK